MDGRNLAWERFKGQEASLAMQVKESKTYIRRNCTDLQAHLA